MPQELDWQTMNIQNLGYRLVAGNRTNILPGTVASWIWSCQPRAGHFDHRITVTTPLKEAGAYLLTSKMARWQQKSRDHLGGRYGIVKKPLDSRPSTTWRMPSAASRSPSVQLDFFGYSNSGSGNHYQLTTSGVDEDTDADGLASCRELEQDVTINGSSPRRTISRWPISVSPMSGINRYDESIMPTRSFVITDRPVYRPAAVGEIQVLDQTRRNTIWRGRAPVAGQQFNVQIERSAGAVASHRR